MARLDWRRRVVCVPSQVPGLIEASGLEPAEVEAAAWALAPCGRWHRGAGAIAIALEQLLPGGLPILRAVYALPGLHRLADAGYGWVVRNRHHLPGTAVCAIGPPAALAEPLRSELARRLG